MLDSETKRRIDSARDILVGKVPDPKAQVEQITTALIYKFMDDMDRDAELLGGKASFIVEELEPYKWANLMSKASSGFQRLETYIAALDKFSQSPHIPEIFRKIFKNAFLPYRDPETLNLFLKEIDWFDYDHSENLGNAFEYLLNIMSSQGDAGQFRTPRHIIDFIIDIVKPKKGERILDPACGTAGFLISAYKYIKKHEKNLDFKERKELMENIIGYDISPDMVRLSLVNMYLHQFPQPKVFEHDTLTSEDRWRESFDVILANPPFMTPKGGIRPHKRFRVQAKRSEVLFVDYIFEHLAVNGRAGIIVPEGIIFQSATAYKALRKILIEEKFLWAVVSLPAGIFQPYSGVKTSVLLLDKSIAKQQDSIIFIKVANDGFDLGAQRREHNKNDLPRALELLEQFQRGETIDDPIALVVSKQKIAQSGDYNLTGDRYKETIKHNTIYPMVKLGDYIETIIPPTKIKKENFKSDGKYPVIDQSQNYIAAKTDEETNLIYPEKPVVIFGDHTCVVKYIEEPFAQGADGIKILKSKNELLPKFLYFILKNNPIESDGYKRHFSKLKEFEIPLPPLEVQNAIVEEIEQYQKVIDGAKQVISNYRPTISIDPNWEIVKLGDICDSFQYGTSQKSLDEGEIPCLRMGNIQSGEIDWNNLKYTSEDEDIDKYLLNDKDVLFNRTNSPDLVGKTGIVRGNRPAIFAGYLIRIKYNKNKILGEYLSCMLNSHSAKEFCLKNKADGVSQSNINAQILARFEIPLPSLEEQNAIVEEIEKERAAVAACKQLVEQFETKIKTKIAKIWGEGIEKNISKQGLQS